MIKPVELQITTVSHPSELDAILELQRMNLRQHLSEAEAAEQGFVTAQYTADFLQAMHGQAPSIIATEGTAVVGYALVTTKQACQHHQLLQSLVEAVDATAYKGRLLLQANYVLVGQLCVHKSYRGQGLPQRLYQHFRSVYQQQFSYCVTDVASNNPRSLKAHLRTGFQVINTLDYGGTGWNIVLWDWTV